MYVTKNIPGAVLFDRFSITNNDINQLVEDIKEVNLSDMEELDLIDLAFHLYKKGYKKVSTNKNNMLR